MEFSRQEYWSGLPFPTPKYPPDSGIEPASSALAGGFFTPEPPGCGRSQRTDYSLRLIIRRRVAKSRVTFCNPMDCSPPGSSADAIDGPVCCSEEGGILDPRLPWLLWLVELVRTRHSLDHFSLLGGAIVVKVLAPTRRSLCFPRFTDSL